MVKTSICLINIIFLVLLGLLAIEGKITAKIYLMVTGMQFIIFNERYMFSIYGTSAVKYSHLLFWDES